MLKNYGENGENQSQMNSSGTKNFFKSQRPEVIRVLTNLRNVQLVSFFRLYFCCLLDQDLKGPCRWKNWAVLRWFLSYFKEKENCTAAKQDGNSEAR